MGMVFDVLAEVGIAAQLALAFAEFNVLLGLIAGGWVTILRSIGFFIDQNLVWIISKAFDYFELIISKELFAPSLINELTKNVYFFIAVFVLFKLAIRFMKYIMEPELVSDQNIGTSAIIKRTIVGMCLILFLPSIFGLIRDFQKAIIADDIINKVIMDDYTQKKYESVKEKAPVGRIIGYSVLRGFVNYDKDKFASSLVQKEWDTAEANYDASVISINAGGVGYIDNYYYDYIPIISTIALCYVAWLIIKYCFDVLVRFFKLAILQIISPIVMVDYIFDGGSQGTFKQWTTTLISTFAMLFIRILSLSFVIMVCIHMQMSQQDCINNYANSNGIQEEDKIACENSLLYVDQDGQVDNLLRAAVVIALLAFSMDLPKLFSQIFGLDLEQESSVTGMVQKVGGIAKMVGISGLAIGGGLLGGAIGNTKAAIGGAAKMSRLNSQAQGLDNQAKDLSERLASGNISQADYDKQMANINSQRNSINAQKKDVRDKTSKQMSASSNKAFGTILAVTPVGRATSSFSEAYGAQKAEQDKQEQQEKMAQEKAATEAYRSHQMETADQQLKTTKAISYKMGIDEVLDIEMEDNPNFAAQAQALKDAGFKGTNDRLQVVSDNVVEIKDNTKVIRDNSAASLVNQGIANQKLDNISTNSQITAEHTVNIDEKMDTVIDTTDNISRNVKTAVNTTQTIAKKTDTLINQTDHISHKVDQIEDNTFYSGIDSIESLDLNLNNSNNSNKENGNKLDSNNSEIKKEQE